MSDQNTGPSSEATPLREAKKPIELPQSSVAMAIVRYLIERGDVHGLASIKALLWELAIARPQLVPYEAGVQNIRQELEALAAAGWVTMSLAANPTNQHISLVPGVAGFINDPPDSFAGWPVAVEKSGPPTPGDPTPDELPPGERSPKEGMSERRARECRLIIAPFLDGQWHRYTSETLQEQCNHIAYVRISQHLTYLVAQRFIERRGRPRHREIRVTQQGVDWYNDHQETE